MSFGKVRRLIHSLRPEMTNTDVSERDLQLTPTGLNTAGHVGRGKHQCSAATALSINRARAERDQLAVRETSTFRIVRIWVIAERQRAKRA